MPKKRIHPKEHDEILGFINAWLDENESDKGVTFVESIQAQLTTQKFITQKQFDILRDIIPDMEDWAPETF